MNSQQLSLLDHQTLGAPHNSTPTSIAAAKAAGPKVGTQKAHILDRMAHGPMVSWGYTQDELSRALYLPRSTVCARCNELEREGFIVKTNRTRETQYGRQAAVYRLNGYGG